jgi:DNA transformation protein and related proteins
MLKFGELVITSRTHYPTFRGENMKNMGPKSSEWLASVGVYNLEDVAELGVVETYRRVKTAYPEKVSLNLLYGLQAALFDLPWNELPQDIKDELKRQVGEES